MPGAKSPKALKSMQAPATLDGALESVGSCLATCPRTADVKGREFPYGTAGFRTNADIMGPIVCRCGLMAVLRSLSTGKKTAGVCITASHNPEEDNGVKLIDPSGGLLCKEFEGYCTRLVNSDAPLDAFLEIACETCPELRSLEGNPFSSCTVFVASDTRPSSPALLEIVKNAVIATGASVVDYGVLTTPQLHWLTFRANSDKSDLPFCQLYEDEFACTFLEIYAILGLPVGENDVLVVDGSNGVGAKRAGGRFPSVALGNVGVQMQMRNIDGRVNDGCGAEFVQKKRKFPSNFFKGQGAERPAVPAIADIPKDGSGDWPWMRCAAFDGDADRLVYFTMNESREFALLDGDKICLLYCMTMQKMLSQLETELAEKRTSSGLEKPVVEPLRVGVVQTAFANGASTNALMKLKEGFVTAGGGDLSYCVEFAKTGVKFVHAKAAEFDIGVYFESNGHGTVLADFNVVKKWARDKMALTCDAYIALDAFLRLFNPVTGDATTDLLAVEASLSYLEMSVKDWANLYVDTPCQQIPIPMSRKVLNLLNPHPSHEKWLLSPKELQNSIDSTVAEVDGGRAFCRASGTEDIARVYVEASTKEGMEKLAKALEQVVRTWAAAQLPIVGL